MFQQFWEDIRQFFTNTDNYWRLLAFFVALIGGLLIIKIIKKIISAAFRKSKRIDQMLAKFLLSIINFVLYIFLIVLLAGMAGVDQSSLVTILGTIGLALSLALQDSLSSVANGVLILINKPFSAGDYICVDGVEGNVQSISVLSTRLLTTDNKLLVIPNSRVSSNTVINYSAQPTRRIEHTVSVAPDTDLNKLAVIIHCIISNDPRIKSDPAFSFDMSGIGGSVIIFSLKYWVNNSDYWDVLYSTNRALYDAFNKEGIVVPENKLTVTMSQPKN